MVKRVAAGYAYLAIVTTFLLLQTQVNVEVDAGGRNWQAELQFAVTILDVVTILSGWLLRFSDTGWRGGAARAAWHGAVMLLVTVRTCFAYETHRVSVGQALIVSHVWILASVAVGLLTVARWRRRCGA